MNIIKTLAVYNRTIEKTKPFKGKGAVVCSSVKEEYEQLVNDGYSDYDWSALALIIK